jgi:hypothetical protein
MSQHDYDIANATAPNARTDINNALKALASTSSGTSAPTATFANMIYFNTSTNTLYKRTEADSGWVTLGVISETNDTFTPSGGPTVPAFATQTQAEAGTSSTVMMSPLRTAQAIEANTDAVLAAVSSASPTASVGAYAFMTTTLDSLNTGSTTSGGNLDYCLIYNASGAFGGLEIGASGNPTGTWKLMSGSFVGSDRNNGLFLRTA